MMRDAAADSCIADHQVENVLHCMDGKNLPSPYIHAAARCVRVSPYRIRCSVQIYEYSFDENELAVTGECSSLHVKKAGTIPVYQEQNACMCVSKP